MPIVTNPLPQPVVSRPATPADLISRPGTLAHAVNAFLRAGRRGSSNHFSIWTGHRHDLVAPHLSRLARTGVIQRERRRYGRRGYAYFWQPALEVLEATERLVSAGATVTPPPTPAPVLNGERTFGVELEVLGTQDAICRAMREAGLSCEIQSYNHRVQECWKVVTDSSVGGGRGGRYGCELVSPVLQGAEGERQVEVACRALAAAGVQINRSCGLHVHQGNCETWDELRREQLYSTYAAIEPMIDSFMPASRRDGNIYCGSCRGRNMSATRYLKLNASLVNLRTRDTVEFRHHSGTFEAEKVLTWVRFTRAMMDADWARLSQCETLVQVLGVLNLRSEDVIYFLQRADSFAN